MGWIVNNLFFFVPELLRTMLISLIVMDILKLMNIRHQFIKWLIAILYGIYAFLRIVPVNWETLAMVTTFHELISQIMLIVPYILMMLFPTALTKGYPILKNLFNYHTLHFYFIGVSIIWFLVDCNSWILGLTGLMISVILVIVFYIFAIGYGLEVKK